MSRHKDKDKLRVLLIKEQSKREGYNSLLEQEGKFSIVGEATSASKALELADKQLPDIILIESEVAPARSLDTIKRLKKSQPQINIVLISYEVEEGFISEALGAGASGYIIKTHIGNELSEAISRIELGQIYLSAAVPKTVMREFLPQRTSRRRTKELEPLTDRQKEILKFLAQGFTNKQIAQQFKLSVKTVDAHRANIMNKLKIHDLPGLVKYAIRTGLTTIED